MALERVALFKLLIGQNLYRWWNVIVFNSCTVISEIFPNITVGKKSAVARETSPLSDYKTARALNPLEPCPNGKQTAIISKSVYYLHFDSKKNAKFGRRKLRIVLRKEVSKQHSCWAAAIPIITPDTPGLKSHTFFQQDRANPTWIIARVRRNAGNAEWKEKGDE